MKIFRVLYAIWFAIHFLWVFIILYPLIYICLSNPKYYYIAHKLRRLWGRIILFLGFVRLKTYNKEFIKPNQTYIVVANHASYFDIISITCALPIDLNFIAKIQLQKIPVFGIFFKTIDIAVDRRNAVHSAKAYMRANQQLKDKIRSICIFPEGGIKAQAPQVSTFKEGAFKMAIENNIPILPVSLLDNWRLWSPDSFEGSPGKMRVYIHPVISVEGKTINDVTKLCDETFHIIKTKVESHI